MKGFLRAFYTSSNLGGIKYFLKGTAINRLFWISATALLLGVTGFLAVTLWWRFAENPTVTSLESTDYPVRDLPFPGVAICDMNKISKKRAQILANMIGNTTGRNFHDIFKRMKRLGAFYDFDAGGYTYLNNFQNLLDALRPQFTIKRLMSMLSTPCEELLHSCYWNGQSVNCSRIFEHGVTSEGYCCIFNSNIDSMSGEPMEIESQYVEGLKLTVNNNIDDYFYTSLSSVGFQVLTYIPSDYADMSSGNLAANLVQFNSENFIKVTPTTVNAVPDVRNYPMDKRNCLFEGERKTKFGDYSQSDCLVGCRTDSMLALCGCVPFMIPIREDKPICTLNDIPCLFKFKAKWNSLVPYGYGGDDESLRLEMHNSLHCRNICYPLCSATLYAVTGNSVPLTSEKYGNKSIIHVYYLSSVSELYKHDVVYYWFEILSNFGGICGLVIGCSLVGLAEIGVYLAYKICACIRQHIE